MWDLLWTKSHWGSFSPSTSAPPPPSIISLNDPQSASLINQGCYNRPNIGQHTKWTQPHPAPRNQKEKENLCLLTGSLSRTSVTTTEWSITHSAPLKGLTLSTPECHFLSIKLQSCCDSLLGPVHVNQCKMLCVTLYFWQLTLNI